MIYFDTSYLVRLYLDDFGFELVRALASKDDIASAWHAQAEVLCAFHRARREGRLDSEMYQAQLDQFHSDQARDAFHWLRLTDSMLARLEQTMFTAPTSTFLRAADAMHLACAAEYGFTEVHSNDRHFLTAAPVFGLRGVNVIPDR